jgi:hypothetical protein
LLIVGAENLRALIALGVVADRARAPGGALGGRWWANGRRASVRRGCPHDASGERAHRSGPVSRGGHTAHGQLLRADTDRARVGAREGFCASATCVRVCVFEFQAQLSLGALWMAANLALAPGGAAGIVESLARVLDGLLVADALGVVMAGLARLVVAHGLVLAKVAPLGAAGRVYDERLEGWIFVGLARVGGVGGGCCCARRTRSGAIIGIRVGAAHAPDGGGAKDRSQEHDPHCMYSIYNTAPAVVPVPSPADAMDSRVFPITNSSTNMTRNRNRP